jgi:hypothetical protein
VALLVALASGDAGWGIVALGALLAPRYAWGGGGPACLVTAVIGISGAWYLGGRGGLAFDAPPGGPAGGPGFPFPFPFTGAAIALYAALGSRGMRVATLQGGPWRFVAAALAAALATQGAVAVAAALRLLPASAVPAPFLDPGGARVVLPALLLGLLLRLSGEAGGAPGQDERAGAAVAPGAGAGRGQAARRLHRAGTCFLLVFVALLTAGAWQALAG